MNDLDISDRPMHYADIEKKSKEIGFTMPSDLYIGVLLKSLIASKPNSRFLELGTGIGLSLSWMVAGMNEGSELFTIDNDSKLSEIAKNYFGQDARVKIICEDGSEWIKNYRGKKFDLVFADAWPGKYSELDELLNLINVGGFYVVDDLNQQPNWPEGHFENVNRLVNYLEERQDLVVTKMNWSTGLIIAVKK
ncbi:class I SAM-dependent methyltransferase [Arenibacter sp. F20364]|uniref:O-methyltransferase n=1 Tax=Arenibacter sp. F20364 TaxID=2926415 RepID=UPI001FF69A01|nr:class I SAM-dependent methyltransferase [Arenibacter sp. F20364]MCK0192142.1 class I SAM-dependent methyltransferase [Arenibacter sp. F20364]